MIFDGMQKKFLSVIALFALLSGCDGKEGYIATPGAVPAIAELPKPGEMSANTPQPLPGNVSALRDMAVGERVYRNTCSLCHRLGSRGAPRLGDKKDWELRLAQGNEVLYDRAVNGYRGNKGSMPSRGSNAKLSESKVKAAVDYMVWYSVPRPPNPLGSHMFSTTTRQSTIR